MKKNILLIGFLATLLILTGCVASPQNKQVLGDATLETTPQWELSETTLTPWLDAEEPEEEVSSDGVGIIFGEPGPALVSKNNLAFADKDTGCRIAGIISYTDSYKESRGDTFNSKDYLYGMVPDSEAPVVNEIIETIHEVDYIVGEYTQPKSWGDNPHHKTAVRVFGSVLDIENVNKEAMSKEGPHGSDPSKGLIVVTIDYSCPSAKQLNKANWDEGLKHFNLLTTKQELKTNIPPAPAEGEEHPTSQLPTEEELKELEEQEGFNPPTVYDEPIEDTFPETEEEPTTEDVPKE